MGGSYLAQGGVLHAKTMLAYHRDGRRTATGLLVVFGLVFGMELTFYLTTWSHPFGFGAGFALLMMVLGGYLRTRHGKQVRQWTDTLERWERVRKDRLIHARILKDFEL